MFLYLGIYLIVIMCLTSLSVAQCVFILHLHRLGSRNVRMPPWLHHICLHYLAPIVGLSYLVKQRHHEHQQRCSVTDVERNTLRVSCEDLQSKYKLIQIENNGLYILAKDDNQSLAKDDKDDINDLHRIKDKRKMLRAMKAVLVQNPNGNINGTTSELDYKFNNSKNDEMWQDVAHIIDRLFFWLCLFTITSSTIGILVIMPLTKPDIQQLALESG